MLNRYCTDVKIFLVQHVLFQVWVQWCMPDGNNCVVKLLTFSYLDKLFNNIVSQ